MQDFTAIRNLLDVVEKSTRYFNWSGTWCCIFGIAEKEGLGEVIVKDGHLNFSVGGLTSLQFDMIYFGFAHCSYLEYTDKAAAIEYCRNLIAQWETEQCLTNMMSSPLQTVLKQEQKESLSQVAGIGQEDETPQDMLI